MAINGFNKQVVLWFQYDKCFHCYGRFAVFLGILYGNEVMNFPDFIAFFVVLALLGLHNASEWGLGVVSASSQISVLGFSP